MPVNVVGLHLLFLKVTVTRVSTSFYVVEGFDYPYDQKYLGGGGALVVGLKFNSQKIPLVSKAVHVRDKDVATFQKWGCPSFFPVPTVS